MENYKPGIDMRKYLLKGSMMNSSYNLGEYRQKYTGTSSAQNIYSNFVSAALRKTPVSAYAPLK